jgi:hypothetical protein
MRETALTSETSVDNYFRRQFIPEDNSELYTRRRENLKSHVSSSGSYMSISQQFSVTKQVIGEIFDAAFTSLMFQYQI